MASPRAIAVVGQTASGKSDLGMWLAENVRGGGEILCMDSMQIYRRMDIGTAKPTAADQARVPHHLLDIVDPMEPFTVAQYAEMAHKVVIDVASRGHVPIFVGGTGLYLKTLLNGMTLGTVASDAAVREKYAQICAEPNGSQKLHELLEQVDEETAARLHPNDTRRVIRALEVYELTGVPMSRQQKQQGQPSFPMLTLGLKWDRAILYERIESRVERMLEAGLQAEVEALLQSGVPEDAQSLNGIGYKEIIPALRGAYSMDEAKHAIILNTKHYAKRQETLLKSEAQVEWLAGDSPALQTDVLHKVEQYLAGASFYS